MAYSQGKTGLVVSSEAELMRRKCVSLAQQSDWHIVKLPAAVLRTHQHSFLQLSMAFTGRHYNKEEVRTPRVECPEVNWSLWVNKLRMQLRSLAAWNVVVWDVVVHDPLSWLSLLAFAGACASARTWQQTWQNVSQRWTSERRVDYSGERWT